MANEKEEQLSEGWWTKCCHEYLTQLLSINEWVFSKCFLLCILLSKQSVLIKEMPVDHLGFSHLFLIHVHRVGE
jgi:hypothetical protein